MEFRPPHENQLYGFIDAGAAWNDGYSYADGLFASSSRGENAGWQGL
jgi:hypothetical protein